MELPDDQHKNIWTYYSIMHIMPIVMGNFIILTILVIDKSLQLDLYNVHNRPAFHPKLGVHFTYVIEGLFGCL